MSYLKPPVNTFDSRRILISFVPEKISSSGDSTNRQWAEQFETHLNSKNTMAAEVLKNQAGSHEEYSVKIRERWEDFIVVYTVDYALSPPPELSNMIDNIVRENSQTRMWIAQYDADNYQDSVLARKFDKWHVLTGQGKGGARFRQPNEIAWKDDLTDAAAIIHKHSSCEQRTPICPKHTVGDNTQQHSKSIIGRIFTRFRRKQPN